MNGLLTSIAHGHRSWRKVILAVTMTAAVQLIATTPALIAQHPASPELGKASAALASQRSVFIENKGQWDSRARFLLQTGGMSTWITDRGVVYDLYRSETSTDAKGSSGLASVGHRRDRVPPGMFDKDALAQAERRIGHVVRVSFDGAMAQPTVVRGTERVDGDYNYFLGNDSTRWATHVGRYAGARIDRLYKGVDAIFYVDGGRPRYDLVIAPGADPSRVAMRIEGATTLAVTPSGSLNIGTTMGVLEQRELYAYQNIGGVKSQVRCAFEKRADGRIGFDVGAYDHMRQLVIDPLVYSTFIGEGVPSSALYYTAVALGDGGTAYLTGYTLSPAYPTTTGAYDVSHDGWDVFVTQLSSSGSELIYSTFLGGASWDLAGSVAVDASGNAYATGSTSSSDYPTSSGAFDASRSGNSDAFITKLTPNGSDITYSTLLGGAGYEESRAIALDADGNAYVTGRTGSNDFPKTPGTYGGSSGGSADLFVTKVNPTGSGLDYSTFFGGSSADWVFSISLDESRDVYVTGYTWSTDYPTTSGAFDRSFGGTIDAFVTKLRSAGSALDYSTLLGGSSGDYAHSIAVDVSGNAYVTGATSSGDYPTTGGTYDPSYGSGEDGFVTKLNSTGSGLDYSTFLGGSGVDQAFSIALDAGRNAYVSGWTRSTDFPTSGGAFDVTHNGDYDAFVSKLNPAGSDLGFSTFVGGSRVDRAYSIAVDADGNAYVMGVTSSADYPTTSGAYDVSYSGEWDVFVTKLGIGGTLALVAPDGGETWCAGSAQNVTWSASGITNVRIELSSDAGATWPTIITSSTPAASGSYPWSIPIDLAAGTSYVIRISDASNTSVVDVSNASFTINTPPSVTLQPASNTPGCPGTSVTFSTAVAGSPAPALQWQSSIDGLVFDDIPGETSTTLTIVSPALLMNGTYYRAKVTNSCAELVSMPAQLVVVDAAAPVPDVSELPTVNGECSATITSAPTATDDCVGIVTGTTTDSWSYSEQGSYTVHWTYDDGHGNVSTQEQMVIVADQTPPTPDATDLPAVVGQCSATILSAPSATDNCAGPLLGMTDDPLTYTEQGSFIVHWLFDDGHGNVSVQEQLVTVADDAPPTISVEVNSATLWPANHTMWPITATVTTADNCADEQYVLTSIVSSEDDDGLGDGDFPDDIQDAAVGTADLEFGLRAERLGNGPGRVYTITYTVTDAGGNTVVGTATVSVPHSHPKPSTGADRLVIEHLGFASHSIPNPLTQRAAIVYHLPAATLVTVRVHDGLGRIVATLAESQQQAGAQRLEWSALDATGEPLPAGLYYYTIEADGTSETGTMVLVR